MSRAKKINGYYTIDQFSKKYGINRNTLYKYAVRGWINYVVIDKHRYLTDENLNDEAIKRYMYGIIRKKQHFYKE